MPVWGSGMWARHARQIPDTHRGTAGFREASGKPGVWADFGPTLGRLLANFGSTFGANVGSTFGQLLATFGQLSTNFRPTFGKLLASFWQTFGEKTGTQDRFKLP